MKALFIVLTPVSLDCETQYSIECCRGFEDMKDEIRSSLKVDMKWKFLFSDMIVQAELERRLLTIS